METHESRPVHPLLNINPKIVLDTDTLHDSASLCAFEPVARDRPPT